MTGKKLSRGFVITNFLKIQLFFNKIPGSTILHIQIFVILHMLTIKNQ